MAEQRYPVQVVTDPVSVPDPNLVQARMFTEQLELVATQLELQVTALEKSASMRGAKNGARLMVLARARRLELYEARAHIDSLRSAFPPA
ncbi:hypothetical protein LX13_000310 [Williamsia maris]|uniref:Uncharacterized protein n=1 Tax=Williamsia maris TaxID=72806 RepID=A0ABT1H8B2_9NOCA|nr:hypothetical protein [Williamsia maris]